MLRERRDEPLVGDRQPENPVVSAKEKALECQGLLFFPLKSDRAAEPRFGCERRCFPSPSSLTGFKSCYIPTKLLECSCEAYLPQKKCHLRGPNGVFVMMKCYFPMRLSRLLREKAAFLG